MDNVRPRSVHTKFDVIVTGAGISFDPPSELPSAAMLVNAVWSAVRQSLSDVIDDDLDARVQTQLVTMRQNSGMRMEQFLEVLTKPGTIPTEIIVNVYRLVGGAAFNENHLRLAALDAKHFTLNMDKLIEEAGPGADVVHLHGVWDKPRTIRTTVSHYSKGLSRSLSRKFGRALEGSNVLVIGYSGRDTDVIPIFDKYPPLNIVWVAPHMTKWEPEVLAVRRRYDEGADPKSRFIPKDSRAGDYLPSLVPIVPPATGTKQPSPPTELLPDLQRHTLRSQRIVAVANLLFELGFNEDLRRLLDGEHFRGGLEAQRKKIIARTLARQGDPRTALQLLTQPPANFSELVNWASRLNEIASIAARAGKPGIARRLRPLIVLTGTIVPTKKFRRRKLLTQMRTVQSLAVAGKTREAVALGQRVIGSRNLEDVMGDASLVNALTWHADALKSSGSLRLAQQAATRAVRFEAYGNGSQAAYAKWKLGEVLAAQGRADGVSAVTFHRQVIRLFRQALSDAMEAGDNDTIAWIHGTFAEFTVDSNIDAAKRHIKAAARAGALSSERGRLGPIYHLLQRSVVEMTAGDLVRARDTVQEARLRVSGLPMPGATLQAEQIDAEISWRLDKTFDLESQLLRLAVEYGRNGMLLNEARARVAAAAVSGRIVEQNVLDAASENGWHDLLRRARGEEGGYPWSWGIIL